MNLEQYGLSQASSISKTYVESCIQKRPLARAVLLTGPPGAGKTTLVHALAETYNAALVELDASMQADKATFNRILGSALVASDGLRIIFFDEADNLTKSQQTRLLKVLKHAKCPIFIAGNAPMEREVIEACLAIVVQPVRGTKSMRSAKNAAAGGEELAHPDDADGRIFAALKGGRDDVPVGDWWAANVAILDNTRDAAPLAWDLFQSRYRKVGRDMEKYAQRALRLNLPVVERPWTARYRWGGPKTAPVPKAPQKAQKQPQKAEPAPPPPAPPQKPSAPVVGADSFF